MIATKLLNRISQPDLAIPYVVLLLLVDIAELSLAEASPREKRGESVDTP